MSKNPAVGPAAVLCSLLAVAAGGRGALGQVEVVFANSFHAPGSPKSFVPGNPDGTHLTFKNFQRPFRSSNGLGWAMTPTVNGPSTAQDQLVLVGSGLSGVVTAMENITLDSEGVLVVLATNVLPRTDGNGNWITAENGGERIITGGLTGTPTVVVKGSSSPTAPAGVIYGASPFGSAGLTALGPSFQAVTSLAPGGANKIAVIGPSIVLSCPIDVPTGQAGGTAFPMSDIDANSFWTASSGTRWLAKGKIANPNTAADAVVVVSGAVVVQEGSPVGGISANVTTITDAFMETSGDWCARGSASDGAAWAVVNGVLVARVGSPIVPGSSENYASLLDVRVNGKGDYVVVGRTNNPNADLTDVIVVNGRFIVARESDGVDLDGDGQPETDLFLNIFDNKMMFSDDGYLYFGNRLKALPTGTADAGGASTNASMLRVAACPADIGRQGGVAGADGELNNNDFIAFIDYFFSQDRRADRGVQGGVAGTDGQFDNNDFVVYIDQYFSGCGA